MSEALNQFYAKKVLQNHIYDIDFSISRSWLEEVHVGRPLFDEEWNAIRDLLNMATIDIRWQ